MKFPVRLLIGAVAILTLFFSLALPLVYAETPVSSIPSTTIQNSADYVVPNTEPNVPRNLHTLSQSLFLEILSALTCQLGGVDFATASHQCLSYNLKTGKIGYVPANGGILSLTTKAFVALYTPPFHTSDYIHYVANNFGLTKHAYAATSGFDQLSPLTKLWIGFRNVVYLLFVIIFVVIGFAIMVRAKIDPRTVMTIENQIPKIIIALLLVTFSFAIAGLMIDLMWLLIYVTINVFASVDPKLQASIGDIVTNLHGNPLTVADKIGNGGILGIASGAAASVYTIFYTLITGVFSSGPVGKTIQIIFTIGQFLPIALTCTIGNLLSLDKLTDCINQGGASEISFIVSSIAFLIFLFAIFAALLRLLFALLRAYVLFLIYVIMGPFFIMLGVLPGSKVNFENWIRHIAAYLFVFPTTIGIFLLGRVLSDSFGDASTGFVPPLLGSDQSASSALGPLIGFAIIMLAPSALAMMEDFLAAPPFKFLPQIGQGVAAGGSIVTGGFNKTIWDPLFRERNVATGAQEGLVRHWFTGGINDQASNPVARTIGRWFGLRKQAEGYGK